MRKLEDLYLIWVTFSFPHTHVCTVSSLDVFTHIIIGSVQDQYVSYIVFCFCPHPPPFLHVCCSHVRSTPVFLCLCLLISDIYLEGY
jgi:hypothetical protein